MSTVAAATVHQLSCAGDAVLAEMLARYKNLSTFVITKMARCSGQLLANFVGAGVRE